ncbi:MAG: transglutaminase domain-containing protein [Archangiaceae bacterium]|nr:transglutaminase domain-containing protein [Archangiaceae bacterium]
MLTWLLVALTAAAAPAKSEVVDLPRPADGEYLGLYLNGKKIGYTFMKLGPVAGKPDQFETVNEFVMKAMVGNNKSERYLKDVRVYEAKPKGKLLSFFIEKKGDGGDETLEGTSTAQGLRMLRKRPNQPNEVKTLPAARETVEDADQYRLALKKGVKLVGDVIDAQDLEQYRLTTTPDGKPPADRTIGGVTVKVRKVVSIFDHEKVETNVYIDDKGRIAEMDFQGTMRATAEPPDVAKKIDVVEVFSHTRITLPNEPSPVAREIPGQLTLVATGVPEKFRRDTYRQKFKALDKDQVEITITALQPTKTDLVRPLTDPNGGTNLKSTLAVESAHPKIVELAKKVVGNEKNAYAAAKKVVAWVGQNMTKDYGSSSDRASDIVTSMKGDCTEHALLAVAMLRSLGIPARRVDGVVYLKNDDGVPALYWHEWVEAYVGEWTQLDPTFNQPVADATHFAVGEESNAEITPLIGSVHVVKVK